MRRTILFLVAGLLAFNSLKAQLNKNLFPLDRDYANSSFYISPALTHSFVFETTNGDFQSNDSLYSYSEEGKGRLAYGIEIGLYQAFERPNLFHYFEGGLAYREFRGEANHEGVLQLATSPLRNLSSENTFKNRYLSATLRGVRADQIGKFTFLHSAIGFNANYLLTAEQERSNAYPNGFETFDRELNLQAHFQIGLGIRLTELVVFIPNVEIPFQNLLDFEPLEARIPAFSSKYQPVLFNFKLLFLRKNLENCNAPTYDGIPQ